MAKVADNEFLDSIPPFSDFRNVARRDCYRPLPDGWVIGASDIVDSTEAIISGRYKEVNTVGASVISAVMNLDRDLRFPFVFGGDGASFAIPGERRDAVAEALAACRTWSDEDMDLSLRAALIPVAYTVGTDFKPAKRRPVEEITYWNSWG